MEKRTPAELDLERRVLAEYEQHLGRVIAVSSVCGYIGTDSVDIHLDTPALVRVVKTDPQSVVRWMDDWLDPQWDVELVEPHPALKGVDSLWVYATSYHPDESPESGDILGTWPLGIIVQEPDDGGEAPALVL